MATDDRAWLRVQVLGPVRAWLDDRELDVGSPQQRAVLAVLALAPGKTVSRHELIDAVWDAPPVKVDSTLNSYISRLRQALEPGHDRRAPGQVLAHSGMGYVLRTGPGQVDAMAFTGHVAAARQASAGGDLAAAAGLLETALELWQGTALAGVAGMWAQGQRTRLEEARLSALEAQAGVKLALGEHAEMIAELTDLTRRYPLREGLGCLLMLALYRCGRQADALAVFRGTRQMLDTELGIEPGPALRRLHEQILTCDPALAPPVPAPPAAVPVPARPPMIVPRELPADVSAFTGRAAELAELDALLVNGVDHQHETPTVMIRAVSGTAGVGKTALAVHWAHQVSGQFPDGQLYVNLRGYDPGPPVSASEALAGFLRALGVTDEDVPLAEAERATRYRSLVAGKHLLVLLDNAATIDQVRPLLPGTAGVTVVVTSRNSLPGLVAVDGARRLDLDLLPAADAVTLLRTLIGDRVGADQSAAGTLAELCARLPLALRVAAELAATRPHTPLAELVAELAGLQERLELLDAGGDPRGAVTSVFSWSYRYLPEDAARLFRLLGLHPGPDWDRYAAAALGATSSAQATRVLTRLAQAHLIQSTGPHRYGMHDLLRGYAAGLAASHEQTQAALTRLFDYYLATCAAAMDVMAPADRQRRPHPPPLDTPIPELAGRAGARAWLDAELGALTAVASYTASHGWPAHTTRLAATLDRYLDGGHHTDGLTIHTHALNAALGSGDRSAQARALTNLGHAHDGQGRYQQATGCYQQAVDLAHDLGDQLEHARALGYLGGNYFRQGRYQQAISCNQQARALFLQLNDRVGEASTLGNLGIIYLRQGRYEEAARQEQQALTLTREIDHRHGEAIALTNLGEICCRLGRYREATEQLRQALTLADELGNRHIEADALTRLGEVSHRQREHSRAASLHQQALTLFQQIGERDGEAEALTGAGETLLATGQPAQAHACHTAALTLTRQTGNRPGQARALTGLGQICHQQGEYGQAASFHRQALALFREIGDRGGEAEALTGAGETLLATGQPAQAHACHTAALTLTRQTGDRYQQAHAHQGLADTCQATGQLGQAGLHRQHAMDIFEDLGTGPPPRSGRG